MSVAYNTMSGIQGDPLSYLSQAASASKKEIDKTGAFTRLIILGTFVVIIILYYVLFSSLGKGNVETGPIVETSGKRVLEVILWSIFVLLLIINGFQYFFNVNLTASISDLFTKEPKIDLKIQKPEEAPVSEMKLVKEVYNIPDNKYTYDDAKAICQAYGGNIANYEQIESAYKKGAEWCNYGWSDNQMALFPTQKKTWDKLQTVEGHENDCGRPGINGGYIDNPNVRFGVNCYGNKPFITPAESNKMQNAPYYPESMKDIELQKKLEYWKKKIPEILISPFNKNSWSILG